MKYLDELKSLNLPQLQFAIFGSGPMAIRGIRESNDIDVIVKQNLWKTLVNRYQSSLQDNPPCLKICNIEIYKKWPVVTDTIDELIDSAEKIKDFPFVQLKYVIEWKKYSGRKKDLKDIELLEKYQGDRG
ncbi:MAG TPA: hypothetical protein ENI56_03120 [Candidatus Kaiserbacteria bacterium]|nr:hypothetical protein [Candidatus Kaiserbacteria bacterium]